MKKILILIIIIFTVFILYSGEKYYKFDKKWVEDYLNSVLKKETKSIKLEEGFVPNKDIALSIALPVLFEIYGKKQIEKQKPYQIFLINNYWIILGSLPKNYVGGTFKIIISKENGEIIHIMHYE